MTISESDLIEFLQAIKKACWTTNQSRIRLDYVAYSDHGPDDVEKLRMYANLEIMEDHISVQNSRVHLETRGRRAARKGSLDRDLEDKIIVSDSPDPDTITSTNPFSESWLAEDQEAPLETVVFSGNAPLRQKSLRIYLRTQFGMNVYRIGEGPENPDLIVLGRKNNSTEEVTSFLFRQRGTRLQVCSHEMLLSWAYTGLNPNQYSESLNSFIDGHPLLEHVNSRFQESEFETADGLLLEGDKGDMIAKESSGTEAGYKHGDGQDFVHEHPESDEFSTEDPFSQSWLKTRMDIPIDTAVVSGQGPFDSRTLWSWLNRLGVKVGEVDGEIRDPDVLVLGQDGYSSAVSSFLSRQQGNTLRICSQEMLLSWMCSGRDPNDCRECLNQFIDGHLALECVRKALRGRWPRTGAVPSISSQASSDNLFEGAADESPLHRLGYRTGKTGKEKTERHSILKKAFHYSLGEFPGRYSLGELDKWGASGTGKRLKKMADHIAFQCRMEKRKDEPSRTAISHWEADLDWLKKEFYHPLDFGFDWPSR